VHQLHDPPEADPEEQGAGDRQKRRSQLVVTSVDENAAQPALGPVRKTGVARNPLEAVFGPRSRE
jgi:hypothetical protein